MALVEIEAGPHLVTAVVTRDAVEELGLAPGMPATATVKATSVMVERGAREARRSCARLRLWRSRAAETTTTSDRGSWSPPRPRSRSRSIVAPEFGDKEDADVRLSFAGSDELAAQIRQGAKVDVFAAANTTLPEELTSEGCSSARVRQERARGRGAAGVAESTPSRTREDGTKVAIGSESVPIGMYTRETLAKLPPEQERRSSRTCGRMSPT